MAGMIPKDGRQGSPRGLQIAAAYGQERGASIRNRSNHVLLELVRSDKLGGTASFVAHVLMSQEAIDTTHTATLEARFILDLNGQRPLFPWHFQAGLSNSQVPRWKDSDGRREGEAEQDELNLQVEQLELELQLKDLKVTEEKEKAEEKLKKVKDMRAGLAPIHVAARDGKVDEMKKLFHQGTNKEERTKNGDTALHWAATGGHAEIINFLLDSGVVKAKNAFGESPLHCAAESGQNAIMQVMLKHFNQECADDYGVGPSDPMLRPRTSLAAPPCFWQLTAEATTSEEDQRPTALHLAAAKGREPIVKLMLEFRANKDCQDSFGRTALNHAAWNGHAAIVEQLLTKGADKDRPDQQGWTPLTVSAFYGHSRVVERLLYAGASKDHQDNGGAGPRMRRFGEIRRAELWSR
eukprot:g33489.t1